MQQLRQRNPARHSQPPVSPSFKNPSAGDVAHNRYGEEMSRANWMVRPVLCFNRIQTFGFGLDSGTSLMPYPVTGRGDLDSHGSRGRLSLVSLVDAVCESPCPPSFLGHPPS